MDVLEYYVAVVVVWNVYGMMYGEDSQKCFIAGLAVGLLAAGLLTKLLGIPLGPGAGKASVVIDFLASLDLLALDKEGVEYCLHH